MIYDKGDTFSGPAVYELTSDDLLGPSLYFLRKKNAVRRGQVWEANGAKVTIRRHRLL